MAELNGQVAHVEGPEAGEAKTPAGVFAPEGGAAGHPPAAVDAGAAAQAGQEEESQRQDALRETEKIAARAVAAFMAGERAALRERMECARLCNDYLVRQMALAPEKGARKQRALAVERLELDLRIQAQKDVKVNDLLAAWAAWRLLAEGPGKYGSAKKPGPAYHYPYNAYRDVWARCVERADKDTAKEAWVLLPGFEARCHEAFAQVVGDELAKEVAQGMVREIVADHAAAQADHAEAQKREADGRAEQERLRAEAALGAVGRKSERLAEIVLEKDKAATAQEKQALAEAEGRQRQELLDAQREAREAEQRRQDAERERQRLGREAREANEQKQKQQRKLEGQHPAPRRRPEGCRAANVLPVGGTCGTVKDTVEMLVGFVVKHDEQDDVALGLAKALAKNVQLSPRTRRAFENAAAIIEGRGEASLPRAG